MDRVDSLIAQAERLLENAPELMARDGSVADARLLAVIALLLDAVKELAKRNDPLGVEKAEAAGATYVSGDREYSGQEAEERREVDDFWAWAARQPRRS